MSNSGILEKLKAMISEQLNIDVSKIDEDTEIIKGLGADSLDLVELLMNVEAEWEITIDDSEVADMVTVGDVVSFIDDKIA